ncbi:sulfotransferase 1B1-like [Ptychodera flava]|uniref:sulfotransferase 1B1-like n=1 Tax=Ptychodera flava TaxID=63121 RepID=UPI00396A8AA7
MADQEAEHVKFPRQYEHGGVTFLEFVNPDIVRDPGIVNCREDDVFVASYQKSGTTVTIEMVTLLLNGADVEANRSAPQNVRVPMVEFYFKMVIRFRWFFLFFMKIYSLLPESLHRYLKIPLLTPEELDSTDGLKFVEKLPKPRVIKCHLPYRFFPTQAIRKKCKIIYVARNPKDVVVSMRYHLKNLPPYFYWGPWDTFYRTFIDGKLCHGDWFDHVIEWWNHREDGNILFLKYEDLIKRPRETVRETARFLDVDVTPDMEDRILSHCSFKNMKENPSVNFGGSGFIRKGIIGDWTNYFTVAQDREFDKIYSERMRGTGLDFEW